MEESDASDQEDLLQLYHYLAEKPQRPKLQLPSLGEEEFEAMCRFQRAEFAELRVRLRIPETITMEHRHKWNGNDALFVALRRLAYPCRLSDLAHLFGLSVTSLSLCVNFMLRFLMRTWKHLLEYHESRFGHRKLQEYDAAIASTGCPLARCVGFIDGTLRPLCRPVYLQAKLYNGHKRVHALKFQSVVTPDGMVSHLSGPFLGNRHDSAVLLLSGLLDHMEAKMHDNNGPFRLYGDAGYPISPHLIVPFKGAVNPDETAFNQAMSKVRITVEWGFGTILQQFAFVDF